VLARPNHHRGWTHGKILMLNRSLVDHLVALARRNDLAAIAKRAVLATVVVG
jgi:hypothetical protein